MVQVKVYDIETGHMEIIRSFELADIEKERARAAYVANQLIRRDHGTSTVYYVDELV